MKKIFDDNSYIDIVNDGGNIKISLAARDDINFDQISMISIEISKDDLIDLLKKEEINY